MRKLISAAIIAAAVAGSAWAAGSHMDATGKTETISGELLDMSCYLMHEGKAKKHAKYSAAYVPGVAPPGVLTKDGKVYLVVGNHEDQKPTSRPRPWRAPTRRSPERSSLAAA